ncbi:hypothetical protein DOTSEDRAFT_77386 [Dothistroma septosporum NZE10]|uniref:Uncharacterized protein n=1 Tax=Dothistroma septosporum (strain NZE10 / CBS 128990) TaxID=675120 RepID=N1Q5C5_DOTSN|nr:hypothetical protein DOTSEDRAFT_77386 [Dothistroma septosporum NZE10]
MKTISISALVLAIATAAIAAPKPPAPKSAFASVASPASVKTPTADVKAGGAATKSTSSSMVEHNGKPVVGSKTASIGATGEGGVAAAAGGARKNALACTNRNAANGKSEKPAPAAYVGGPQSMATPIPKSISAKGDSPKPTLSKKPKRWAESTDSGNAAPTDMPTPRALSGHGASTTDVSSYSSAVLAIRSMTAHMKPRAVDDLKRALGINGKITTSVSSVAAVATILARDADGDDVLIHVDEGATATKTVTQAAETTVEVGQTITSGHDDDEHDDREHEHEHDHDEMSRPFLCLNDGSGSLERRDGPCDYSHWLHVANAGYAQRLRQDCLSSSSTSRSASVADQRSSISQDLTPSPRPTISLRVAPHPISGGGSEVNFAATGTEGAVNRRRQAGTLAAAPGVYGARPLAPASYASAVGYVPNTNTQAVPKPPVSPAVISWSPGAAPTSQATDLVLASTPTAAITPGASILPAKPPDVLPPADVAPGMPVADLASFSTPLASTPPLTAPAITPAVASGVAVPSVETPSEGIPSTERAPENTLPSNDLAANTPATDPLAATTPVDLPSSPDATPTGAAGGETPPYPMRGSNSGLKVPAGGTAGVILQRPAAVTGGSAGLYYGLPPTGKALQKRAVLTGGTSGLGVIAVPTGSPISMAPRQTTVSRASIIVMSTTDTVAVASAVTGSRSIFGRNLKRTALGRRAPDSLQTASAPPPDSVIKDLLETGFKFQYLQEQRPDICTGAREECEQKSSTLGNNTALYGYRYGYTQGNIQDMIRAAGLNRTAPTPLNRQKRSSEATGTEPEVDQAVEQVLESSFKILYWQTRVPGFCWGPNCGAEFIESTNTYDRVVRYADKHGCSHHIIQRMVIDVGLKYTAPQIKDFNNPDHPLNTMMKRSPTSTRLGSSEASSGAAPPSFELQEDVIEMLRANFAFARKSQGRGPKDPGTNNFILTVIDYAFTFGISRIEVADLEKEAKLDMGVHASTRKRIASIGQNTGQGIKRDEEPSATATISKPRWQEQTKSFLSGGFSHLKDNKDMGNAMKCSIQALAEFAYCFDIPQSTVVALMKKAGLDGTVPAPRLKTVASGNQEVTNGWNHWHSGHGMATVMRKTPQPTDYIGQTTESKRERSLVKLEDFTESSIDPSNDAIDKRAPGSEDGKPAGAQGFGGNHPSRREGYYDTISTGNPERHPRCINIDALQGDRSGKVYEDDLRCQVERGDTNEVPGAASTPSGGSKGGESRSGSTYAGTKRTLGGWTEKAKKRYCEKVRKGKHRSGKCEVPKKGGGIRTEDISRPMPITEPDISGQPGTAAGDGRNYPGTGPGSQNADAGSSSPDATGGNGQDSGTNRKPGTGVGFGSGNTYGFGSGQGAQHSDLGDAESGDPEFEEHQPSVQDDASSDCTSHPSGSESACSDVSSGAADVGPPSDITFHADALDHGISSSPPAGSKSEYHDSESYSPYPAPSSEQGKPKNTPDHPLKQAHRKRSPKGFEQAKETGTLDAAANIGYQWLDHDNARRDTGAVKLSTGPYSRPDSGIAMSSDDLHRDQESGAAKATGAVYHRQKMGAAQPTGIFKARQTGAAEPTGSANVRDNAGAARASDARTIITRPNLPRRSPTPTAALTEPAVKRYVVTDY